MVGIDDAGANLAVGEMIVRAVHEERDIALAVLIMQCAELIC